MANLISRARETSPSSSLPQRIPIQLAARIKNDLELVRAEANTISSFLFLEEKPSRCNSLEIIAITSTNFSLLSLRSRLIHNMIDDEIWSYFDREVSYRCNCYCIKFDFDKGGLNNNVNNNQHLVLFIRGKAISAIIIVILQLSDKLGRIEGFNNDPPREKGRRWKLRRLTEARENISIPKRFADRFGKRNFHYETWFTT